MASIKSYKKFQFNRLINRKFSEELKKQVVKDIENGLKNISGVSREYEVSRTAIYKWIYKYSNYLKKGQKLVVEKNSKSEKIKNLEKRIKELERIVGLKQMEIDFKEKMLELGSKEVGFDIKKKYGSKASNISGYEDKNSKQA